MNEKVKEHTQKETIKSYWSSTSFRAFSMFKKSSTFLSIREGD